MKKFPGKLFGTSGIRGRVDELLTPELAVKFRLTFAALMENEGTVLVGRDVRLNSRLIQNAFVSGLLAGGIDVVGCDMVPTPALLFALKKYRNTAAVMGTGGHTPAPVTGLLFFLSTLWRLRSRLSRAHKSVHRERRFFRTAFGRRRER